MSICCRYLVLLTLLLGGHAALAADELRVSYALGKQDVTYSPDGAEGVDGEWDDNTRIEVGAYSNLNWMMGFGVGLQQAEVEGPNNAWALEYDVWTLRTYVGKTPVVGQSFSWEILGYSGVGLAKGDLSRNDGGEEGDDSSFIYEFGAQTNVVLSVSQQFVIGAGAGYDITETTLDIGGSTDLEQQGLYYHAFLGYKF